MKLEMHDAIKICRAHLPKDEKEDYATDVLLRQLCDLFDELKRKYDFSEERSKLRGDSLLSATKKIERLEEQLKMAESNWFYLSSKDDCYYWTDEGWNKFKQLEKENKELREQIEIMSWPGDC